MSDIEVQNLPQPERVLTCQGCFNCKNGGKAVNVRCSTTLKGEKLTDTKTELQWDNIDWTAVYRSVNRLQTRITKAVLLPERVMKGLSGMIGNFHVPFLEGGKRVTASSYSAGYGRSCI